MSGSAGGRWNDRTALAVILTLTCLAAGAFLPNDWVQDEYARIVYDRRVHDWGGLWRGFVEPYWAPPSRGGLYRPLGIALFTVQWIFGQGSVLLFRLVDVGALLLASWTAWKLARAFLPLGAAFVAAAIFAVHPLHTEVMAVAVNQAETLGFALLGLAVLRWRTMVTAQTSPVRSILLVLLCYLGALGFKEHALILPALLLVVDLASDRGITWSARLRDRGLAYVVLLVAGAAWWILRGQVLGDLTGAVAAEGLRDRTVAQRALVMLGVIPEWTRLFLWPLRLQIDYAPREIDPELHWTATHILGLLLLTGWIAATAWAWRVRSVAFVALTWLGVGLLPVHNVLLPTGTLLAERTLFLPSFGVALLAGVGAARLVPWWRDAAPVARGALVGLGSALLAVALVRDVIRAPDWASTRSLVVAELRDSPLSFHAQTAAGIYWFEEGDRAAGERHLREAIRLWPNHARPFHTLADYYRSDGHCEPAMALYATGLRLEADRPRQRVSAAACALWLGRYLDARVIARGTPAEPTDSTRLALAAHLADSAAAAHAPAGSVRMPVSRDHAAEVGWRRP